MKLDVNVDMGESFGRWKLGDDAGIMPFISSANIACGFHAGDPVNIRETVGHAVEHGVTIGAHVGLPDVLGFGRRRMAIAADELHDMTLYQIGALDAFCRAAGTSVRYVKPHGSLYAMIWESPELADATARAMKGLGLTHLYAITMDQQAVCAAHGVELVQESFVDLWYDANGHLLIERTKQWTDPDLAATRALSLVRDGTLETQGGGTLAVRPQTICIHGDGPNGVDVAKTVRERLEASGVDVAPVVGA